MKKFLRNISRREISQDKCYTKQTYPIKLVKFNCSRISIWTLVQDKDARSWGSFLKGSLSHNSHCHVIYGNARKISLWNMYDVRVDFASLQLVQFSILNE